MPGYSGTPLPKKLGLKPGHHLLLLHAPADFTTTLGELPENITIDRRLGAGPYDVIVAFCPNLASFAASLKKCTNVLSPSGGLWIAWPKKSSGLQTDLNENLVRDIALKNGLVDNKVCAIDDTWSGLRLVVRLKDRAPNSDDRRTAPNL
jgi:hypothetical protein